MKITMKHIRYYIFGTLAGAIFIASSLFVQAQEDHPHIVISQQTSEKHTQFHYPKIDDPILEDKQNKDGSLKAIPYLSIPFRKVDLEDQTEIGEQLYDITEAWDYSEAELSIHNVDPLHGGIDFYVPYGTEVIAPVSGYVMSSYHIAPLYDENGEQRTYQGKPIQMGLGYFVYFYVPEVKRWLEIGHLSDIDQSIPFTPPNREDDAWIPPTKDIKLEEYMKSPNVTFVKKGQPIGKVGYSGLTWGNYEEYTEGAKRPIVIDLEKYKSWDEPHIHFEEFWFHQETGEKGWQRDPYGIYSTYEKYPTLDRPIHMGKDSLWLLDEYNYPQFAE